MLHVKTNKKLSYRLENRALALCFRLIIMLYSREFGFSEFSYTLRVRGYVRNDFRARRRQLAVVAVDAHSSVVMSVCTTDLYI